MNKKNTFFNERGEVTVLVVLAAISLIAGTVIYFNKVKSPQPVQPQTTPVENTIPQAQPTGPSVSFTTEPVSVGEGQDFDLVINLNPLDQEVHAFELYFSYDPSLVEFSNQSQLDSNIVSSHPLIRSSIDTGKKTISIIGTKLSSPFAKNTASEVARIKMMRKGAGNLEFFWKLETKIGKNLSPERINGIFN